MPQAAPSKRGFLHGVCGFWVPPDRAVVVGPLVAPFGLIGGRVFCLFCLRRVMFGAGARRAASVEG